MLVDNGAIEHIKVPVKDLYKCIRDEAFTLPDPSSESTQKDPIHV